MRQFMHSRLIRNVSFMLILAMVSSILPLPLMTSASAQITQQHSVAVVELFNESGYAGEHIARYATDAVVVEMGKSGAYDVSITRTQLKDEMEKLGIHAPLSKVDLVRLGDALSADAMLEGTIKEIKFSGSGASRRASATLIVQMIDQASGEIINGAVQTGTANAKPGYTPDDESLVMDALNNAAFLCVKQMVDYNIPEATVMMNVDTNQIMLNRGSRDGFKPGMRMIVLRQKEIIGFIELSSTNDASSIAKVTKPIKGIKSEDKARAIYEMPVVTGSTKTAQMPNSAPKKTGRSGSAFKSIGKFILGAAVVYGIVSIFNKDSAPLPIIVE